MLIFRSIVCLFFLTYGYAQDIEPKAYRGKRILHPLTFLIILL